MMNRGPSGGLTIVVPALNEEEGIGSTLEDLTRAFPAAEIIVVDDGSADRTAERVSTFPQVALLKHEITRGYGASIKTGVRHASHETIAWYDADGQHTPEALTDLLGCYTSHGLQAAIGSRTRGSAFEARRKLGKAVLSLVVQVIAGRRIADINCGLRVVQRNVLRRYLHLLPDGFSASITMMLLLIKRGYRIEFVPIVTKPRIGHSTVRMFRDGIRAVQTALRIVVLFQAFQTFSIVAAVLLLVGSIYGLTMALTYRLGLPALASVLVLSGIIIFFMGLLTDQVVALRMERLEEDVSAEARPPIG